MVLAETAIALIEFANFGGERLIPPDANATGLVTQYCSGLGSTGLVDSIELALVPEADSQVIDAPSCMGTRTRIAATVTSRRQLSLDLEEFV